MILTNSKFGGKHNTSRLKPTTLRRVMVSCIKY
jgi:hypothetical protein